MKNNNTPILTAISILFFVLGSASIFALSKSLNLPIHLTSISLFLGLALAFYVSRRLSNTKKALLALALTVFLLFFSLSTSNLFFDISVDGTWYHQDAILELENNFDFLKSSLQGKAPLYTNNYPKLSWFYSASIYELTRNIHYGKSLNFLLMFALWLTAYSALTNLSKVVRILFATILTVNPIIVAQIFTHYVDGAMAGFLSISILGLYGFFWSRKSIDFLVIAILGMVGCAALKQTGFVFSLIIALATVYWVFKIRPVPLSSIAKPVIYVPTLVIAVLLIVNPYFKNFMEGKHIFHPSMGEEKAEGLISGQITKQFYEMNRFSKLIMSSLGETDNRIQNIAQPFPAVKFPFTVSKSEIEYSGHVDARWGGWGPLFGGVLLVTIGCLLFRAYRVTEYKEFILLLAFLSIINPEAWWARLNPQLFTFTVIVLLFLYINDLRSRLIVVSMLLMLMINSFLIFNSSYNKISNANRHIEGVIKDISDNGSYSVCWESKQSHLEPIFHRLEVNWISDESCLKSKQSCGNVLGEKICRSDSFN
jgi:hypothetical protein